MSEKLHVYKARVGRCFLFYITLDSTMLSISCVGSRCLISVTPYTPSNSDAHYYPQSSLLELLVITGITQEQVFKKIEEFTNSRIERVARWKL